jgi:hypothetical protein
MNNNNKIDNTIAGSMNNIYFNVVIH